MTREQKIAKRILQFADIFKTGCTVAGPKIAKLTGLADPLDCEECTKSFVEGVFDLTTWTDEELDDYSESEGKVEKDLEN